MVSHCLWTTVHTTTHSPQSKSKLWSVLEKNTLLTFVVCCLATKFDKQISSQERGGGVRGLEQWIRMATDYNYYVHEQHHLTVHLCSPVNIHVQRIVNTPPNEVTLPLTQSMLSLCYNVSRHSRPSLIQTAMRTTAPKPVEV